MDGLRLTCACRLSFAAAGRRACRLAASQPHPRLLAHEFRTTGFSGEYSGSREYLGVYRAQRTPRNPNPPRYGAPRRARASRQTRAPSSVQEWAQDHRGRRVGGHKPRYRDQRAETNYPTEHKRRPGIAGQIHPADAHVQATASRAFRSLGISGRSSDLRAYTTGRDAAARLKVFFSSRRSCSRRPRASAPGEATGDGEVGASSCAAASSPCAICRSRPTAAGASS